MTRMHTLAVEAVLIKQFTLALREERLDTEAIRLAFQLRRSSWEERYDSDEFATALEARFRVAARNAVQRHHSQGRAVHQSVDGKIISLEPDQTVV